MSISVTVEPAHPRLFSMPFTLLEIAFLSALVTWPVSMYSLAMRARGILGHWPKYGAPDPKSLASLQGHWALTWWTLLAFAISLIAMPIAFLIERFILKRPPSRLLLLSYAAFAALGLFVWFVDPAGITEWFLD